LFSDHFKVVPPGGTRGVCDIERLTGTVRLRAAWPESQWP